MIAILIGRTEEDSYRESIFRLCYHQHGGSGLNFSLADLNDMPLRDLNWYIDRLDQARDDEARAIKSAGKTTPG